MFNAFQHAATPGNPLSWVRASQVWHSRARGGSTKGGATINYLNTGARAYCMRRHGVRVYAHECAHDGHTSTRTACAWAHERLCLSHTRGRVRAFSLGCCAKVTAPAGREVRPHRGYCGMWLSKGLEAEVLCACGWGCNKEFTPRGQGQGRNFYRDFAQPSHVVRGNNAAPDSTKGLPQPGPAATGHRASPGRGLQGDFATRGKFTSYGNRTTSGEKHAFSVSSVQNVNRTIFVAERILGH